MPRIALQLHPDFVEQVCEMVGVEPDGELFGNLTYAVAEAVTPTEFNFKLMTEDQIFEMAQNDSEMQILSL